MPETLDSLKTILALDNLSVKGQHMRGKIVKIQRGQSIAVCPSGHKFKNVISLAEVPFRKMTEKQMSEYECEECGTIFQREL